MVMSARDRLELTLRVVNTIEAIQVTVYDEMRRLICFVDVLYIA